MQLIGLGCMLFDNINCMAISYRDRSGAVFNGTGF